MPRQLRKSRLIALSLVLLLGLAATPAYAHGFGQRYDLPVPLWLYLTGAGAAVAFSFVVIGFFVRGTPGLHGYPRLNLRRAGRLLTHPAALFPLQAASVAMFVLVVVAGALGSQNPRFNIAPTAVWVVWWVGMAYLSALVGDLWALLNPWKILFSWAEALYRLLGSEEELSFRWRYPERLGVWPGLLLFLAFAWAELVYPGSASPRSIATMAAAYSGITWAGMLAFGKHQWLRQGEAFTLVFGLLARFAPTEVLVRDPAQCQSCSAECLDQSEREACVNCYECFEKAAPDARALNLRPYAAGLLHSPKATPSFMALVVMVLATVTFDGFTATPLWAKIVGNLYPMFTFLGGKALTGVSTLGLLAFPAIFLVVYFSFSVAMAMSSTTTLPVTTLARTFIFSIVPIALAYHVAHYLSFLLIQGQVIIAHASDPLGLGWDLLGTAGYKVNIGIINARFAWFTAVAAIVAGHIIAVYVAHVVALRTMEDRKAALRSQYPMLVLMVGYTMVSLWIIAQPIVETARKG